MLRYGVYGTVVDHPRMEMRDIALKRGVRLGTVVGVCHRYRKRGWQLYDRVNAYYPPKAIDAWLKRHLLRVNTLISWVHLSLKKRVAVLKLDERFHGVKISAPTLRNFYKEHNIRYSSLQYKMWNFKTENERIKSQAKFLITMAKCMESRKKIVFLDETSVHSWYRKNKCWNND